MLSGYYNKRRVERNVREGRHRQAIGGQWNEMGQLQYDFLISKGLTPQHRLLDIGCGSLRGGVRFVRYLDPGNYFGTDMNEALLDAGYDVELRQQGLDGKLPRANLITDGEFEFSWVKNPFDFALAQSVFSHLPSRYLRQCLSNLAPAMKPGGRFYCTFFRVPENHPADQTFQHQPGPETHPNQNPYHYKLSEAEQTARDLPWTVNYIGDWQHPRSQEMLEFTRQ